MRFESGWKKWLIVISIATPSVGWAETDLREGYLYAQIGPILGIIDDSFDGDYEDTIGVNGRIGGRGRTMAVELQVEGLPDGIVNRSENSKSVGEDIVNVTVNLRFFLDVGPFETYAVAGIGLVTLTEVILIAALTGPDVEISSDRKVDFHARAGLGVQFPLLPHVYGFVEGSWNGGSGAMEQYSYVSLNTGIGVRFY